MTAVDVTLEETVVEKPTASDVAKLINELFQAAETYYHTGNESPLTDEEFDTKLAYLEVLSDDELYADLFKAGSRGFLLLEGDAALGTTPVEAVVSHKVPMLSLAKAKKETDLYSFLDKIREAGGTGFQLQAKLDGLALSVRYENGKVALVATRGDGAAGDNVTHVLADPFVTVKGLEKTIDSLEDFEVRGELFFTDEQFKRVDDARFEQMGVRFKNSRNSATGLLKASKLGVSYPVEFTFAAYSVFKNGQPLDIAEVHALGFKSVETITDEATPGLALTGYEANSDVMVAVARFGELRSKFNFPTDGVVIKPMNEAEMLQKLRSTSHHPVSQIAWKYPDETAMTTVKAISITVGASGKVTPIAHVVPVSLEGSTIQNASLHNFSLVAEKDIRIGSVVLIEKANSIIPQIQSVVNNSESTVKVEVPTECPICSTVLSYDKDEAWPPKTLRCENFDCESRMIFALKSAVGKAYMDIDGLSTVSLEHLNSIGRVTTIADFYTLTLEELADSALGESQTGKPRRLGEKRAQNILDHIEKSKVRPFSKMVPALSIDGLGISTAKALEKAFKDIDGLLAASEEEIALIEGLGSVTAKKIVTGLKHRAPVIEAMRAAGVTFGKLPENDVASEESSVTGVDLTGLSFAISGAVPSGFKNRGAWVDYVEAQGGEFHSAPKAHTSFMVGNASESSSKVKAAVKHGVTFISPEKFMEDFVMTV